MARLTDLPFELLLDLLLLSGNTALVAVNRYTYICLRPALTPRTCYRFVRHKGDWLKGRVIASSLPYRFLSTELLAQIEQNEHELLGGLGRHGGVEGSSGQKHYSNSSKARRAGRAVRDLRLEDIKIPNRLFVFSQDHPLPQLKRKAGSDGCEGARRKRSCDTSAGGCETNPNQTRLDVVRKLLRLKLSVQGPKGSTGLVMAARAGNLPMVKLLLKHGANASTTTTANAAAAAAASASTASAGATGDSKALLMAVVNGHLDIVKRLVRAGAPVSSLALRYAVQKKHAEIVSWLMKKGAAPDMLTIKLLD
ncbi:hypothetical protein IWW48_004145 [Coemansia sp. RSA 1200]|nr:hypothetical protein IWW48_004145 [Coemansia sp. RSA 1200]